MIVYMFEGSFKRAELIEYASGASLDSLETRNFGFFIQTL